MKWAALLKGFNIGNNRMPMPEMKRVFEANGYRDVTTLLASGNVVFDADETDGARLEGVLEAMLAGRGLKVCVVVRNRDEMRATVSANPFPEVAEDRPAQLAIFFHRDPFPGDLLARLAEVHAGPERLVAIGRDLYGDYPLGQGASTLPQAMAKLKFPKVATARNWNTVVKLAALLE